MDDHRLLILDTLESLCAPGGGAMCPLPVGVEFAEKIRGIASRMLADDRFQWKEVQGAPVSLPLLHYIVRVSRENRFAKGDDVLCLLENDSIPQYLWPAAAPFATWIANNGALFRGKVVLELGSGVGLCGLAASYFAQTVVLSDMSIVSNTMCLLSIAKSKASTIGTAAKPNIVVSYLKWGEEAAVDCVASAVGPIDIVIGSDIFYFRSSLESGLKTAAAALNVRKTRAGQSGGTFYCASFVRSERMDDDIDSLPSEMGFMPHQMLTTDDDSLRVYRWDA